MDDFIPVFWPMQEQRAPARKALEAYLELKDPFHNVVLPESSATKAEVTSWWRTRQPSHSLREMGLWCCALGSSQGQSERYWALVSRQVQPIRNALKPQTKELITSIACNWRLLYPDVPWHPILFMFRAPASTEPFFHRQIKDPPGDKAHILPNRIPLVSLFFRTCVGHIHSYIYIYNQLYFPRPTLHDVVNPVHEPFSLPRKKCPEQGPASSFFFEKAWSRVGGARNREVTQSA